VLLAEQLYAGGLLSQVFHQLVIVLDGILRVLAIGWQLKGD